LFGNSHKECAEDWLNRLPSGSITTWDQLKTAFFNHFFPYTKYVAKRKEISNFQQEDKENLKDAWERYKLFLKGCP